MVTNNMIGRTTSSAPTKAFRNMCMGRQKWGLTFELSGSRRQERQARAVQDESRRRAGLAFLPLALRLSEGLGRTRCLRLPWRPLLHLKGQHAPLALAIDVRCRISKRGCGIRFPWAGKSNLGCTEDQRDASFKKY